VPIYEFSCEACGEDFERLVDPGTETAECPACGTAGARRRLSSFSTSRGLTPNQRRRLESQRGIDRGGAKQRFKRDLAARRKRAGGGG
jgi:putative FmdB family regulatory protein